MAVIVTYPFVYGAAMRLMFDGQGRPVLVDHEGNVVGRIRSIDFPSMTIPTPVGDVHELNRAGKITGDVVLQDGRTISNAELPIG